MCECIDLEKWLSVDIYSEEMKNVLIPVSPVFIYKGEKYKASDELYQKILRRILMCRNLLYRKKCKVCAISWYLLNLINVHVSFAFEKHINEKPYKRFADCLWENSIRQSNLFLYKKAAENYITGDIEHSGIIRLFS